MGDKVLTIFCPLTKKRCSHFAANFPVPGNNLMEIILSAAREDQKRIWRLIFIFRSEYSAYMHICGVHFRFAQVWIQVCSFWANLISNYLLPSFNFCTIWIFYGWKFNDVRARTKEVFPMNARKETPFELNRGDYFYQYSGLD